MGAFIKFWWDCVVEGFHIGDGFFGFIEGLLFFIAAGLGWDSKFKHLKKYTEEWEHVEKMIMKWTFVITLALFVISTVFIAPFLKYREVSQVEKPVLPAPVSNPKPDKITPALELPPPVTVTLQSESAEVQPQFETNLASSTDIDSAVKKERAATAQKQIDMKKRASVAWPNNISTYEYAVRKLYDILSLVADQQGDQVVRPINYFTCLPPTLDSSLGEIKVAEIKLANQPNMSFQIIVTPETWINGNFVIGRGLRISCSCGNVLIAPTGLGKAMNVSAQIPDGPSNVGDNGDHQMINQQLLLLVGSQKEFLVTSHKN